MTLKEILISGKLTVSEGGGGGGSAQLDALIDGSITDLTSNALTIRSGMFKGLTTLNSVTFPQCTLINSGDTFYNCTGLQKIAADSFPEVTEIKNGNSCFNGCTALSVAVFPKLNSINGNYNFTGCRSLAAFDAPLQNIGPYFFQNDTSLVTVVLRRSTMTTLQTGNCFSGSAFDSTGVGGTLYVPQALISSYQSDSNWSTILGYANNKILPIEGSIYETQYADGTPIA